MKIYYDVFHEQNNDLLQLFKKLLFPSYVAAPTFLTAPGLLRTLTGTKKQQYCQQTSAVC
jgi:hypothetical protein